MRTCTHPAVTAILTLVLTLVLPAATGHAADAQRLTAACETALALSALPERLRGDASVYVLTENGYRMTRDGDGPFTCIVERNHRRALIPQCPDAAGADTIVPGIIYKSSLALEGVAPDERRRRFDQRVADGAITAPARPGISYMMSDFNYAWNARRGELFRIPPHVMFYAQGLDNDDIGGSMAEGMGGNRGYPFIVDPGAHGYIVSMVERGSDPGAVLAACEGQLPQVAPVRSAQSGGL